MPSSASSPFIITQVDLSNRVDAEALLELLNAYSADPMGAGTPLLPEVSAELIPALQRHPGTQIYFAKVDGQYAGVAVCFTGFSTFNAKPLLNIHDLYVHSTYRSEGVAAALIARVADQAKRQGCCKITLEVRKDNQTARGLYKRLGFTAGSSAEGAIQYLFLERPLS